MVAREFQKRQRVSLLKPCRQMTMDRARRSVQVGKLALPRAFVLTYCCQRGLPTLV